MSKLHKNQQKLLELLAQTQGVGLTFRQMQEELGVSSPSVVQHHISQLEKKGYIKRNPYDPQDYIVLLEREILNSPAPSKNILGVSSPQRLLNNKGFASLEKKQAVALLNVYAEAFCGHVDSIYSCEIIDQIEISPKVLGFSSDEAFIVKAKGDSMENKIKDKDYVIARRTDYADSGDVVVCLNDERLMIKKYNRAADTIILSSLNQKYEPFMADQNFRILGLVRGVISNRI